MFFDRSGPTEIIWYYDAPRPEGRRKYSKTNPLRYEELADALKWFRAAVREEGPHAWKVSAADVVASGCNLDIKNPRGQETLEHLPPEKLADSIAKKNLRVGQIMDEIRDVSCHASWGGGNEAEMSKTWNEVPVGEVLARNEDTIDIVPGSTYQQVTVRLWGKGVVPRGEVSGIELAGGSRFRVRAGQFIMSRIDARHGAFGIVPNELDGALASSDFPSFNIKANRLRPGFLGWLCRTQRFVGLCYAASKGTTNRVRLRERTFPPHDIISARS